MIELFFQHCDRTFTRFDNQVRKSDSGFYIHSYDRLGAKTVKNLIPEMENATKLSQECEQEIFCGIPFFLGLYHGNRDHSVWIPGDRPRFPKRPRFTLNRMTKIYTATPNATAKQFTFTIEGPSRMSIHLSPIKGARMTRCTLLTPEDEIPPAKIKWHGRDVYFINFTVGKRNLHWKKIEFTVEIEGKFVNRPYIMDIGFVAQYINYYDSHTEEFKNLVKGFPSWTNVQYWSSLYEGYQY